MNNNINLLPYRQQFMLDASNLLDNLRKKNLEWMNNKTMSYYNTHDVEYIKKTFTNDAIPYEELQLTNEEITTRNDIYCGMFMRPCDIKCVRNVSDDLEYIDLNCDKDKIINLEYMKSFLENLQLFLDIYSDKCNDIICSCLVILDKYCAFDGHFDGDVKPVRVYGFQNLLKSHILEYDKLRKNADLKYRKYIVSKCVGVNSNRIRDSDDEKDVKKVHKSKSLFNIKRLFNMFSTDCHK